MGVLRDMHRVAFQPLRNDWRLSDAKDDPRELYVTGSGEPQAKPKKPIAVTGPGVPNVPIETRIWNAMSGAQRAEVMHALGITMNNPKAPKGVKALRACAAFIKKNLAKYKHILRDE